MESLLRIRSGSFEIGESCRLDDLQEMMGRGEIDKLLIPVDTVFLQYKKIQIGEELDNRLKNGNSFVLSCPHLHLSDKEHVRIYDSAGNFTAIYKYVQEDKRFKAVKMFL